MRGPLHGPSSCSDSWKAWHATQSAEARGRGSRAEETHMKGMQILGGSLVTATVLVALGCSDRDSGRMPTDPALEASATEASFDRGRGHGDDGSGSRFRLFGNARMTRDPENGSNVVLEVTTTPSFEGAGAARDLHRVKIWQLDHQLNFHRAFVAPHTCGGGSPRIALLIDANGDGKFRQAPNGPDFAAAGHVRPPFAGCETSTPTGRRDGPSPSTLLWRFEDLTDEQIRWEVLPSNAIPGVTIGPIGGAGAVNWDALEAAISNALPNHRVVRGIFVEDFTPTPGTAYYDLITIFDLTLGTRGQATPERGKNDKDSDSEN